MTPSALADLLLPGAGLAIDGRPAWGLPLLVPAVLILAGLCAALLLGGFVGTWALPRLGPAYLLLIAIAAGLRWRLDQRRRIDPEQIRRLARATARAWLRREPTAPALARDLVRAAPELPQAWRLLALVADDPRAQRRAAVLERQI